MISFFRIIKMGFTNFWRNRWLSAASTLIMVITLIILSTLALLFTVTKYSVNSIRERVDISAYFKTGLSENQIIAVKESLEKNPKVSQVTYVSAEDALGNFNEKHKLDQQIIDSIGELSQNPLPATLQVKANNLDDYSAIADQLNSDQYKSAIEKVNFEDNRTIIERLNSILRLIVTLGIILVVIFAAIAILVIFNTITLTIYNRREEVEIMKLVGATNWYIRGPFIIEALMYSVMGTLITSALLIPVYINILPKFSSYLNIGQDTLLNSSIVNFEYLVILQLIIACLLSIISSLLAIRKYLKI